jgi:glycosyltransferase involved in cell wall biosynthesis
MKINYFRDCLSVPDTQIGWLKLFRGIRLARQCKLIYVSCSPFSAAMTACMIKRFTGKPLIVDFRDPWAENPYARHTALHGWIVKKLEKRVVNRCDRLVVNTPGAAWFYQRKYPHRASDIVCIPNGYDQLSPAPSANGGNRLFTIMHLGTFYGARVPDVLLEALSEMNNPDIEFVQVGPNCDAIDQYRSHVRIRLVGPVSRDDAIDLMKTASMLYLKQGRREGVSEYIAVAAKTYEYLATGLPILADVPPGDDADMIRAYGRNSFVVTSGDKSDLRQCVEAAYLARHEVVPETDPLFAQRYNRATLTRKLADEMGRLLEARQ